MMMTNGMNNNLKMNLINHKKIKIRINLNKINSNSKSQLNLQFSLLRKA